VQSLLGEGAMGSVFKAFDPVIKRIVALKTIKLDQSKNEEDQREFVQRFFQEAQISGILNHPSIVSIYDIGEQDGMPYIAMEYVEGRSLNQIIHEEPRPGLVELAKIVFQVATALEFAHSKGIVHRDLKPGNIMVMPNGLAKIMDFGIAKMSGSHLTQTGVFLGTPSFASPEQIKEGQVDYRSDIFSLGILAHESLTSETPFPGQSISAILYRIANEPPKRASNLNDLPVDPPKWTAVFARVFQKDPALRYQSAAQFGQDLLSSLVLSEDERAQFGTFVGQINATVQSAFGIQKDIQRSEFEKAQAPRPIAGRGKGKRTSPLLWVAVMLMFVLAGAIGLWNFGFLGPKADISSIIPTDFVTQIFSGGQQSHTVVIETDPAGAKLYVDEVLLDHPTPWPVDLTGDLGREFSLKLEKEGFLSVEKNLVLSADMEEKLTIELEVEPVNRSVRSVPDGARISIDGKSVGSTPVQYQFLPGKAYDLEFSLKGYHDVKLTYREGEDSEKALSQDLKKVLPPGKIRVSSVMEDLRITFNGKKHSSPFSVPPGSHRIKLTSHRYFYSKTRTVKVASGKTVNLETPPILTIPKINVIGSYAKVKIDGRFVKSGGEVEFTPIIDLKIAAGSHVFEFVDDDGKIIDRLEKDVNRSERIIVDSR